MAGTPWKDLEMTVAQLHFDLSVAAVEKTSDRIRSVTGFCSEDEKAEQNWESMMKRVDDHHHELFLNSLQPS